MPTSVTVEQRLAQPQAQWRGEIQQSAYDLRVAIPGTIQAFDAATQTVTVRLAVLEKVLKTPGAVTEVQMPDLLLVPLVTPRGGGMALTLPVKQGDECLVVFADMDYAGWWQSGGVQSQLDKRRHDLSDGFAILGPWNQTRLLPNYSTTSAQLRTDDGTVVIDIAEAGVTITAPNVTVNAQNASVSASQAVQVVGHTVSVMGATSVAISGAGNTTIEGKNFLTHTHSGVTAGGGVSGPVV